MAIDVYLHVDGISGESRDSRHRNWIECTEVHWGLSKHKCSTASTGGGHAAERGIKGFWIMDQWKDDRPADQNNKPKISARFIRSRGLKQQASGTWPNASNNADAYSVIEMR